MAQQQEQETVDEILEETKKKGGMSRGFAVAILLVLGLAVGGYFAFVKFIQPQIMGTPPQKLEIPGTTFAKSDQKAFGVMYPMEPFLVNLARERSVPMWLFRQYNPDIDAGRIQIGQVVVFPVVERVEI